MTPDLDSDFDVERVTRCRLSGQYSEARQLLRDLSMRDSSSLSTLQKGFLAIEKSELLTTIGLHKRAEKVLRKATRVLSYRLDEPDDLAAWSFAVLLGNLAFVKLHTKVRFNEGLGIEAYLRKKFIETPNSDASRPGLYVISCLYELNH